MCKQLSWDGKLGLFMGFQMAGLMLGKSDGASEGIVLGTSDGIMLGMSDGIMLGMSDGIMLGTSDSFMLGILDGIMLGASDGTIEGASDGVNDGTSESSKLSWSTRSWRSTPAKILAFAVKELLAAFEWLIMARCPAWRRRLGPESSPPSFSKWSTPTAWEHPITEGKRIIFILKNSLLYAWLGVGSWTWNEWSQDQIIMITRLRPSPLFLPQNLLDHR